MCYWLTAIFGGQGGTLDNLQGSVISQVDLLNAVPEGVRLPVQPLDDEYYYLTLADWKKVFAEVFTRMPSYIKDRRDCDDAAWMFKGFVTALAGLNAFGWVIGNIPAGRHSFCMFYTDTGWYILEPNPQYTYGNYNVLPLGVNGYQPDVMVI
jgi:hypothetical protein